MSGDDQIKTVEHVENGIICQLDRNHADQKRHRSSAGTWHTVPYFNKIQRVYGVTEHTINSSKSVLFICSEIDRLKDEIRQLKKEQPLTAEEKLNIVADDLNRSLDVLKPKEPQKPVVAKADTTETFEQKVRKAITKSFQNGKTEEEIKESMRKQQIPNIDSYFKVSEPKELVF